MHSVMDAAFLIYCCDQRELTIIAWELPRLCLPNSVQRFPTRVAAGGLTLRWTVTLAVFNATLLGNMVNPQMLILKQDAQGVGT